MPLFDRGPSRCSPGILLIIFNRPAASHVISLVIRSIETGEVFLIYSPNTLRTIDACSTVGQFHARPTAMRAVCDVHSRWCAQILKKFSHKLKPKKIEFIEQFNEKLLIKQESESLQIVDVRQRIRCSCVLLQRVSVFLRLKSHARCLQVRDQTVIDVPQHKFLTPSAFIFLYENQVRCTQRSAHRMCTDASSDCCIAHFIRRVACRLLFGHGCFAKHTAALSHLPQEVGHRVEPEGRKSHLVG